MDLKQFPSIKRKRIQRIGRSGKRGSYSGRGVKGQRSRSGHRIRPAERDLIIRIPKRRGFANVTKTDRTVVFNLGKLSARLKSFAQGKTPLELDRDLLKAAGLLKKGFRGEVKLLGEGEITFPIAVKGIQVSKSAKMKIGKAGGSVTK